jgi:hypothetical protein
VKTDGDGKLYFWMKESTDIPVAATTGGREYTGTISPNTAGTAAAVLLSNGIFVDDDATAYTTVSAAQTAIQDALNAAPANGTVTVTGFFTGATTQLSLNIPAGKTVIWEANYSGDVKDNLVSITGAGTFTLAQNGTLNQQSATGTSHHALETFGFTPNGTINIHGTVKAVAGHAISLTIPGNNTLNIYETADISVSGIGHAISIGRASGNINIFGGQITANTGSALSLASNAAGKKVIISGGELKNSSNSNNTIRIIGSDNTILITGGTVSNSGTADRFGVAGDRSLIIERTGAATEFDQLAKTGLTVTGAGADAWWDIVGGKSGISYANDTNSGFIEVEGVTVTPNALFINGGTTAFTTVSDIKTAIEGAFAGNNTVTVTGRFKGADTTLTLDIPAGKTVDWQADYSGSITATTGLIRLNGAGTLNVITSGVITNNADDITTRAVRIDDVCSVTVNGGFISSTGSGIYLYGDGSSAVINSGEVTGNTHAVYFFAANASQTVSLTVNGGTLRSTGSTGNAVSAQTANSTVIINDGTVTAATSGDTITLGNNAALTVNGGTIENTRSGYTANVVYAGVSSTVYLTGSGGNIVAGGISRRSNATGFYAGDNGAKFRTSGNNVFDPGTNLFALDDAPKLTTYGGDYIYDSNTAYEGFVVASFSSYLTVTGVTVNGLESGKYTINADKTVTFAGTYNETDITLEIEGTLANGRIPVSFTTAAFGVNVYMVPAPIYTVTIPATLDMEPGDNVLIFTVSETANLNGKTVTVTAAGTQEADDTLVLKYPGAANPYSDTLAYGLLDADDEPAVIGGVLAEFTEDGFQTIKFTIDPALLPTLEPFKEYSGNIIFGISLE